MNHTMNDTLQVWERGWLSANSILLRGRHGNALVDSGHVLHAAQTRQWVVQQLQGQALEVLFNTHLHSDHCGGNAELNRAYAGTGLQSWIPATCEMAVREWDAELLTFNATGQDCERFGYTHTFAPGQTIALGDAVWEIHPAGGHDPDMVMLFDPRSRTLISADALWQQALGVIFPEIEGICAFEQTADTFARIERLNPVFIVPGHGACFSDVDSALLAARRKLEGFARNPAKHAHYAAKVLVKFKLLASGQLTEQALLEWAGQVPHLHRLRSLLYPQHPPDMADWLQALVDELIRAGAAMRQGVWVRDA